MNDSQPAGFSISEGAFQKALLAVEIESGIRLPDSNRRTLISFLSGRLTALDMDMERYLRHVWRNRAEYAAFIDAVTINETYFFREEKHFRILKNHLLPQWDRKGIQYFHFWSAACSSGEEAISLNAMIHGMRKEKGGRGIRASILASDINPHSLALFTRGIYTRNAFRKDGSAFNGLLEPYLRRETHSVIIDDSLRKEIDIQKINLFRDDLSELKERFHLIFLRNTLIYMSLEIRGEILDRVVKTLRPDGYLFLSASEVPLISHPLLELEQVQNTYFFRKKNPEELRQGVNPNPICEVVPSDLGETGAIPLSIERVLPKKEIPFAGEVRGKYPIDTEKILFYASQRLNNRLFTAQQDINFSFALQFLHIIWLIGENRYADGRDLIELIDPLLPKNEISCYLWGYLELVRGNPQKAGFRFSEALQCNSGCWPARFYRANTLREEYPRIAEREYETCARDICSYIDQNQYHYQFMLEGFNAKYFLDMCREWQKRLKEDRRWP